MPADHHLDLTDEDLKDLLRKGFAHGNLAATLEPDLDEFVLLVRRIGFAGLIEVLKAAEQELTPRPSFPPHIDLAELARQNEEAIANYQARMRAIPPTYQPGDRFELLGEIYEIFCYQREGEPGYWLRKNKNEIFIPIEQEAIMRPTLH